MVESKAQNTIISAHRMLEYVPALFLCALAWAMPSVGTVICAPPDEAASALVQNVMIGLCYLVPSAPASSLFVLLVLVISIPISYRSWSRWSRYHLSRNHPIANTVVSLLAILSDYAACVLLLFAASWLGTDRYLAAALLVSLSLGLLVYSEIVSNETFALSQIWKDADIYSLLLIFAALWGIFAAFVVV